MEQGVSRDTFDGRCKVEDERFARDKERIEQLEESMRRVTLLTTEMGEMIKRHDKQMADHETRLDALEDKPAKRWDSAVATIISNIIVAIVTFLAVKAGLK